MGKDFKVIVDQDGGWVVNGDANDFWRAFATLIVLWDEIELKPGTTTTFELVSMPRLALMLSLRGYTMRGVPK